MCRVGVFMGMGVGWAEPHRAGRNPQANYTETGQKGRNTLKSIAQAFAEHITWMECPYISYLHGSRSAKSACRCSVVENKGKMGHTEPGNLQRVQPCTFVHALKLCIQGHIKPSKGLLKLLRPRTSAAHWGTRGGRAALSQVFSNASSLALLCTP